jgi:hypothetical protein
MPPANKKENPEDDHAPDGPSEAAWSAPAPSTSSPAAGPAEAVEEVTEQPPQGPQFIKKPRKPINPIVIGYNFDDPQD